MTTAALTASLLADVDRHLAAAAPVLSDPAPEARAQIRPHLDWLLDYRLVLMAARDALASPSALRPPSSVLRPSRF